MQEKIRQRLSNKEYKDDTHPSYTLIRAPVVRLRRHFRLPWGKKIETNVLPNVIFFTSSIRYSYIK